MHTIKHICLACRFPTDEKSFRHVTMVKKFLDLNKPWFCTYGRKIIKKKLTCMAFLYMIALRNKTVAHTFLPSFGNANYGHGNVTSHFFLSIDGFHSDVIKL